LNLKEFVVPLSLEVGRIIRGFERPSTFNFIYLKYSRGRPYQGHQVAADTSNSQHHLKTAPYNKNKAGRPDGLPALFTPP
ncbi:hypothetical protein, partial [Pseudomonas juntendi]|uniref:hypothetical protein n=1 Tax=Pseudomonas juntendi TaxID=2666183 RepID=UPI00320A1200